MKQIAGIELLRPCSVPVGIDVIDCVRRLVQLCNISLCFIELFLSSMINAALYLCVFRRFLSILYFIAFIVLLLHNSGVCFFYLYYSILLLMFLDVFWFIIILSLIHI